MKMATITNMKDDKTTFDQRGSHEPLLLKMQRIGKENKGWNIQ